MSAEEYLTEKFKGHPLTIKWPEQLPKIMEPYAREYHAKEMERKLGEAKNDIEEQYPEQDEETNGYYDYDCEKRKEGAKWLLNHLKQKQ